MHFTVYALNTWSGLFVHRLLHQHGTAWMCLACGFLINISILFLLCPIKILLTLCEEWPNTRSVTAVTHVLYGCVCVGVGSCVCVKL